VTAADTVFRRGDLAAASARFLASEARGGLGVRTLPPGRSGHQVAVRVEDGFLAEIGDAPPDPGEGVLTAAPLWFLREEVSESLAQLAGPPFELAVAFRASIAAGRRIVALPLGRTQDLTRPEDVLERNFPYLWERG
jgi:hypothetical protein